MSNLLYLLAAIGLSAIGSTLLYLRHRRPTSMEYGIREFSRGLEALDPSRGAGPDVTPPASRPAPPMSRPASRPPARRTPPRRQRRRAGPRG